MKPLSVIPRIAAILMLSLLGCMSRAPNAGAEPLPRVLVQTTLGDIHLELDADRAPITTANFLEHARAGHYDGTIIHRVVPGFVIQGGGWTPDLIDRSKQDADRGRADTPIRNEWATSGLKNLRGTIAMARDKDPDSATREFFINLSDNEKLDTPREVAGGAGYAVFGRVIEGMDIVDAVATLPTQPRPETGVTDGSMNNVPIDAVIVTRVRAVR